MFDRQSAVSVVVSILFWIFLKVPFWVTDRYFCILYLFLSFLFMEPWQGQLNASKDWDRDRELVSKGRENCPASWFAHTGSEWVDGEWGGGDNLGANVTRLCKTWRTKWKGFSFLRCAGKHTHSENGKNESSFSRMTLKEGWLGETRWSHLRWEKSLSRRNN